MELATPAVLVIIIFFCINGSSSAENLPRTASRCCAPGFMCDNSRQRTLDIYYLPACVESSSSACVALILAVRWALSTARILFSSCRSDTLRRNLSISLSFLFSCCSSCLSEEFIELCHNMCHHLLLKLPHNAPAYNLRTFV